MNSLLLKPSMSASTDPVVPSTYSEGDRNQAVSAGRVAADLVEAPVPIVKSQRSDFQKCALSYKWSKQTKLTDRQQTYRLVPK